jgi:hypothetical protein
MAADRLFVNILLLSCNASQATPVAILLDESLSMPKGERKQNPFHG